MLDKNFDLSEYCRKESTLHGKKGDKTLECIGINTYAGEIFKAKAYYLGSKKEKIDLLKEEACKRVYEKLEAGLSKTKGVKLWEVAKFDTQDSNVYALCFETIQVKAEKLYDLITSFSEISGENEAFTKDFLQDLEATKAYVLPGTPPVIQLGVQVDEDARIISTKYYLVLRKGPTVDPEYSEEMQELIQTTGLKRDCSFVGKQAAILEKWGYLPSIMGINSYKDGSKKQKIYFDSGKAYTSSLDVREKAIGLAKELNVSQVFNRELINELYAQGLYVRGVGLNLAREEEIRLYLDQL